MDEQLDYLIRSFTYKRSCIELDIEKCKDADEMLALGAVKTTLDEVLTVIYSLIQN